MTSDVSARSIDRAVSTIDNSARVAQQRSASMSLGLFAFGFILSFAWSWHPSLWTDEAATISAARRSFGELWDMAHRIDAVHTTYYALMHLWLHVFEASPLLLRLPSALAVGLATTLTFWLGKRLATPKVALFGAIAFAALPRTTWMGAEARSYAVSAALAVAETLVIVILATNTSKSRGRSWALVVGYGLLAAFGVAINLYLALLLVAHGISLLLTRNVSWRLRSSWLAASVAGLLLASPVVWAAIRQGGQLGGGDFGLTQWVRDLVVSQWFLGETPTVSTGAGGPFAISSGSLWKVGAVVLAVLCWTVIAVGVVARRSSRTLLVWTLPWIVIPTLVIGLYSVGISDIYNGRYFSFATPAVALLLGHGLVALQRRWLSLVVVVLVVVCTLPVYLSQRTVYAKSSTDWSGVAAFVASNRGAASGQAVYFSPRYRVTGPLVGQTARGVRVAYPAPFAQMTDITLLRTPVQDRNLAGTSRLLVDSMPQLEAATTVWVIRRLDYQGAAADDRTLASAGFVAARQWNGPLDRVIEFTRT